MAFIFADSFDFYNNSSGVAQVIQGGWTSWGGGGGPTSDVSRFNLGSSYSVAGGDRIWKNFASPSSNTVFIAFATLRGHGFSNNNTSQYVTLYENSTEQVSVCFTGLGSIVVRKGDYSTGDVLAEFPNAFEPGVWHHWQIKVVLDTVSGSVTIRQDGAPTNTYIIENVDTMMTFSNFADAVEIGGNSDPYYNRSYFDDFFIIDNTGSSPNDWPGDVRCIPLTPISNGSTVGFTPQTGSNYQMINELQQDGDTTFNYSGTPGTLDLFNTQQLTVTPENIYALTVKVVARKSDTAYRSGATALRINNQLEVGQTKILSSTYTGLIDTYVTNPTNSIPWTLNDINNLETGYTVIE
jgi:hypothetical protein